MKIARCLQQKGNTFSIAIFGTKELLSIQHLEWIQDLFYTLYNHMDTWADFVFFKTKENKRKGSLSVCDSG